MEDLIGTSKEEKYFAEIEDQINDLKKKIYHNKENDLQNFKTEIMQALKEEIVSRYYFRRGVVEVSFDHDPVILEAVNTLNNKDDYKVVLSKR